MSTIDLNWSKAPEGADSIKMSLHDKGNLQWFRGLDVYIGNGKYAITVTSKWQTIATREPEQRKTVEDAVKAYGGKFPSDIAVGIGYTPDGFTLYYQNPSLTKGADSLSSYVICTKKEFEDFVATREPEDRVELIEWTHTYGPAHSKKCKVLAVDGAHCWLLTESGSKFTALTSSLKPIKPKITKAQAWDKISNLAADEFEVNSKIMELQEKYNIVSEG